MASLNVEGVSITGCEGIVRMKDMNSQSGVSLVTILVGLGLMGIMLKIISSSVQNISSVRSFAAKSHASLGVEGALINSLAKSIRKGVVDAGCGSGLTSVIGDQKLSSDDAGTVGFHYTDKIATTGWPTEVPPEHTEAKKSCARPYVDPQGKFYFCIDFNLSNSTARDSFFDSTYAFAEAAVVLTDIHTNKKVSCDYFARNPTTTVSRIWCQMGDLDIMKIDQRNDNNPPLIMTIEPLAGPKKKIYSKSVNLNQLQAPTEFSFNVQEDENTSYLGFFICQDARKDGSCQKKKGSSFSQIYENYQKKLQWGSTEIGRYQAQDDVYYFQFLSIKDARLYVGDPSLFEQKQYGKAFSKYLSLADPSIDSDRVAATVSDLSRSTGSMAAIKTDKGLNFRLPYNDPRCTAVQTR